MYWNWCKQTLWIGWKIIRGGDKITGDKITSDTLLYLNAFTVTRSFNKLLPILLAPYFWFSEILCKVPLNPQKVIKLKAGPMLCCYQNRGGWFERHRRKAQEGQDWLWLRAWTLILRSSCKSQWKPHALLRVAYSSSFNLRSFLFLTSYLLLLARQHLFILFIYFDCTTWYMGS